MHRVGILYSKIKVSPVRGHLPANESARLIGTEVALSGARRPAARGLGPGARLHSAELAELALLANT